MTPSYKMNSTSILDLYLSTYDKYAKIYDHDKVIVTIQVGSFFEFYSTPNEGPDLHRLSEVLNIVVSRKARVIQLLTGITHI